MRSDLRQILEAGLRAPSGDNAQPWRFRVKENDKGSVVDIILDSKADDSPYNGGLRASYFSAGALTENICISAVSLEYSPSVETSARDGDLNAARIVLTRARTDPDPLSAHIHVRCTNRKPYNNIALTNSERSYLLENAHAGNCDIILVEDEKNKTLLARAGAKNEEIMLGNQAMHEFFFNHVNWTQKEDDLKRAGFFLDSLELPAPAKLVFKAMKNWKRAQFLNRYLKINKIVAKQNTAVYASSPAIGIIVSRSESPSEAFNAGRVFERIWLLATSMNLALQPLLGTIFLAHSIRLSPTTPLSQNEGSAITGMYNEVLSISGKRGVIYALFRVGHAPPPSARSLRKPLESFIDEIA